MILFYKCVCFMFYITRKTLRVSVFNKELLYCTVDLL